MRQTASLWGFGANFTMNQPLGKVGAFYQV